MNKDITKTSKFLSFILRHEPQAIGITLDENGWVNINELLEAANASGKSITRELLDEVVFTNDKQRFAYSPDGSRIRANQGHSVESVDLALSPVEPPGFLFHGTVERFLDDIREFGLKKMNRQHVHLSADITTARSVGGRRGKPVILKISAGQMFQSGIEFYLSANGVWLTDSVPAEYISVVSQ
ncbi:RNA 2'-phosphotransferase [Hahella ganghwensis]|uniref:RNA 2'-phosphotransferase n=1 Tax=Hahella ganghwensis TaxID=286420 RepID=UPI000365FCF5|nr:RNA 2'-phosphotransferase [Hahella ganghwensis]